MEVDSSQLRHPAHPLAVLYIQHKPAPPTGAPHILSSPVPYLVVANCSVPFNMDFEFDFDFDYIWYDT